MTDAPATPTTSMDDWTTAKRQAAARDAYLASVADGAPLTGAELGRRFNRTDRWGRLQITKFREELDTGTSHSRSAASNGRKPPVSRDGNGTGREDRTERRDTDTTNHEAAPARLPRTGHPPIPSPQPVPTVTPERSSLRPPTPSQSAPTHAPKQTQREGTPMALTAVRWLTALTVLAIALAAGRASYDHQRAFAEMAGEDRNAWSLPLSVDGMMLVASLTMLVRRWQNKPAGRLAWAALLLGGLASLAANITVAQPTLPGRLAAAWPPLCLLVSIELLLQQIRDGKKGS